MPHRREAKLREFAELLSARMDELKPPERNASRQSQKAAFRAVADELPLVIWTCGPDGVVTWLNRHWHATFGDGTDPIAALHPDDYDDTVAAWGDHLKSGLPYRGMARFRLPDGSYRAMMSHAHAFYADDGSIAYWIGSSAELPDARTHHLRMIA